MKLLAFQTSPAEEYLEKEFLTYSLPVLKKANHPGAESIQKVSLAYNVPLCELLTFQQVSSEGIGGAINVSGWCHPRTVWYGSLPFLKKDIGLEMPATLEVTRREWEKQGTLLFGGWEGYIRGIFKFEKTQ